MASTDWAALAAELGIESSNPAPDVIQDLAQTVLRELEARSSEPGDDTLHDAAAALASAAYDYADLTYYCQ